MLVGMWCGVCTAFGCSGNSPTALGLSGGTDGGGSGGAAVGGSTSAGSGAPGTGGTAMTGAAGSVTSTGGASGTGGASATGGTSGSPAGGRAAGGSGFGGATAGGGAPTAGRGGGRSGGGRSAGGGAPAGGGTAAGMGGGAGTGTAGDGPDCTTAMPTGGDTKMGSNVNGSADGLNYGIWTNGSGGSITVFSNAHAFAASWSNSSDFLAHLGLDFNGSKSYTDYGAIVAQFVESKTGSSGGWSSIGMYGWMHSPCIEWYINEDSFNGLAPRGSVTATIDGATYYLTTSTTTGTGGANACEAGHSGSWTNITSTRASAHQCGTVTVSDHFKAWAAQGWALGSLASVHINVEVGGGTGSIQFPVANVTTSSN